MAAKSKNKLVIILGVVAAVVVAGLIAVFTVRGDEPDAVQVTVTGEPIPVMAGNAPVGQDIAFGWDAPLISGSDWKGNPVTIDPSDGRPKLIVFLAHWCPHCQAEVPEVQAWLNETGGSSAVDLYGVATSINRSRPNWPPGDWLEREGWTSAHHHGQEQPRLHRLWLIGLPLLGGLELRRKGGVPHREGHRYRGVVESSAVVHPERGGTGGVNLPEPELSPGVSTAGRPGSLPWPAGADRHLPVSAGHLGKP